MPYAIDQDALDNPNLKVLDINQPPIKQIAMEEFPRAVYLHPVDKTKTHRVRIVANDEGLQQAMREGWRLNPHVPVEAPDAAILAGEFETAPHLEEDEPRRVGRPRKDAEAV